MRAVNADATIAAAVTLRTPLIGIRFPSPLWPYADPAPSADPAPAADPASGVRPAAGPDPTGSAPLTAPRAAPSRGGATRGGTMRGGKHIVAGDQPALAAAAHHREVEAKILGELANRRFGQATDTVGGPCRVLGEFGQRALVGGADVGRMRGGFCNSPTPLLASGCTSSLTAGSSSG